MAALEPPVRRRRARSLRDEAYRPGANSPAPPPLQGSAVAAWLRGGGERRELEARVSGTEWDASMVFCGACRLRVWAGRKDMTS